MCSCEICKSAAFRSAVRGTFNSTFLSALRFTCAACALLSSRLEEAVMQGGEPSHTARVAAAYRAIHQTLEVGAIFGDPFALRILDDETRARLDETAADPSLRPWRLFIAARSRFSEDTLAACAARGVRQIVVLGAGLDTFSLRNPHQGLRVFEVD